MTRCIERVPLGIETGESVGSASGNYARRSGTRKRSVKDVEKERSE